MMRGYAGASYTNPVYRCPGYKWTTWVAGLNEEPQTPLHGVGSYGYNGDYFSEYDMGGVHPPNGTSVEPGAYKLVSSSMIVTPSEMIAFGDSYLTANPIINMDTKGVKPGQPMGLSAFFKINRYFMKYGRAFMPDDSPFYAARHSSFVNMACLDGHVESMKWSSMTNASPDLLRRFDRENVARP